MQCPQMSSVSSSGGSSDIPWRRHFLAGAMEKSHCAPAEAVKLLSGRDCGGVFSNFTPMKMNDVHSRQHDGFGWTMTDV